MLFRISFELLVASKREKDDDYDAKDEIDKSGLEILLIPIICFLRLIRLSRNIICIVALSV